ncbi:ATP-binding protein, partial [Streptomyces sp. SID6013]|nr:ATP-binding protein [Streptomyces sp. SID6013]
MAASTSPASSPSPAPPGLPRSSAPPASVVALPDRPRVTQLRLAAFAGHRRS